MSTPRVQGSSRERELEQRQAATASLASRAHECIEVGDLVLYMGQGDAIARAESFPAIVTAKNATDVHLVVFTPGHSVHRHNIAFSSFHDPQSWHWKHGGPHPHHKSECPVCVDLGPAGIGA